MDPTGFAVSFADTLLRNEQWTKRFSSDDQLVKRTANVAKLLAAEFVQTASPSEMRVVEDDPETLRAMGLA